MTRRAVHSAPQLAIVAVLAAAGVYLTWLASHHWFLLDDWAFLLRRQVALTGDDSLFRPHNDHWVTLPILVFRLLFHVVGLHHLPYAVVNICFHLVVCALLALMLKRAGADPWVCVLMAAIAGFMGPGGLNILWEFQMTFLLPSALALAALVLVDRGVAMPRFPVGVWVLLGAALMCSGGGVTMVAWVAAYTWLRRGFRRAVVVGLPPTLLYLVWYLAYARGAHPAPPAPPDRIVPFMLKGMTNLWEVWLIVPWSGTVALVLLTTVTVVARSHPRLRTFAAASLLALVFNFLLLAATRAGWGVASSTSTRYLYVGLLLTLPALGLTLQLAWERLAHQPRPRAVLASALFALVVVSGAVQLHTAEQELAAATEGLPGRVVAAAQVVASGDPTLSIEAEPRIAPDIHVDALQRREIRELLPDVSPSAKAMLDAAAQLQVADSDKAFDLPPTGAVTITRIQLSSEGGGCQDAVARAGATLELPPTATGSQVGVTVSQSRILTRLKRHGRVSEWSPHPVVPDQPKYFGTSARDARLVLTLPSGPVTVCMARAVTAGR